MNFFLDFEYDGGIMCSTSVSSRSRLQKNVLEAGKCLSCYGNVQEFLQPATEHIQNNQCFV